ncbi:MAG: hydroxymethylpyrimidine/phosphomethylpyrimidine kinase, partial [Candidatus Aminicenantes bacterium]|nr:hydroxymethylpyrimidine/phosphomethylpyrimidine kinase [Candidatus Aminicenantes bacterium]
PSGGAGVLLDLGVFRARGFRGAAVLTGLTVQNTRGVLAVRPLPARFVLSQYRALAEDVRIAGVKVGMLATAANVKAAARILDQVAGRPRVVDPVLRSSSGAPLLSSAALAGYLRAFRGRLSVLTPNIDEAARLAGVRIASVEDMAEAARRLSDALSAPCLVKGGHLDGDPVDVLFDGARTRLYPSRRLAGRVHGTGCYFSSVLLAELAAGAPLDAACGRAARLTRGAIRDARPVGRGRLLLDAGRSG